ncbi:unnamed protein product [Adineta ricciae]|uniref:CxC5 like cysteine cluster associated with KDZ domain-containing protein n=1 Tax=Adineta ricciae TaxID=249248 RepID=A0A816ED14_ADIRI|nr:unnamed protein product [Adineta ricciae]
MQRFLDAMHVIFEMRKNQDLQFAQIVDRTFGTKAKFYIDKHLVFNKRSNGELISYVALETCHITANLFDNYLFKNILNLFNLDHSVSQTSMPSTQFRTLVEEKPSIEKRILQLPYQFFLRSDLKQPATNANGKRINAPFHHVDNNLLNNTITKLVDQRLLSTGYFISRPKAQQTRSFMKNPIPSEPLEKEEFIQHLESYKINADEYQNSLTRSELPVNCNLLPEAKQLLTTRAEHRDDCIKYGITLTNPECTHVLGIADLRKLSILVNVGSTHACDDMIPLNFENIPGDSNARNLFIEMPVAVTTDNECTSARNVALNSDHDLNVLSHCSEELLGNDLDMIQVEQVQVIQLIESKNKTHDVQSKDCNRGCEGLDCRSMQSIDRIGSEPAGTTSSHIHPPEIKSCVRAILQYPSIILTSSDIALATRHHTAMNRQRCIQSMLDKGLLKEDNYFVRKLSKSVKVTKGFAKKVPLVDDEQSRFNFIIALNEFGISWDLFKSFFDLTRNGFHTTTQLYLNQTAELLLDSDDYRSYVCYDKSMIFRPLENAIIEQDELEYGDNVTDLFRGYLLYSTDVDQLVTDYQKLTNHSIVFKKIEPMSKKCLVCSQNDGVLPVYQVSKTFLFNDNVLEQCIILYSHCKICKWSYYPNSQRNDVVRKQFIRKDQFLNADAFYFGGECVYSRRIFLSFTTALLTMRASFHGFVTYFNSIFTNKTTFSAKKLDEKNFQINWIIYSVLKLLFQWSNEEIIEIPYSLYDKDQANAFFDRHKCQLYSEFVKHWSNQTMHTTANCTARCNDILIVDGHKKTARTTCRFNNCYDNTIVELGPVLVGCPKSVFNTQVDSNSLCKKHFEIVADRGVCAMEFDASDDVTEETCNVKRNELSDNPTRSTTYGFFGFFLLVWNSCRDESPNFPWGLYTTLRAR